MKHTRNKDLPPPGPETVLYTRSTDRSLSVYGYRHRATGKQVFTLWVDESIPKDDNTTRPLNFTFTNAHFDQPVLVDVITGGLYEIPLDGWRKEGNQYIFTNVPVYDAPVLLADKSLIPMH